MPRFIDMYMDGRFNLDAMVSKTIPIEDVNDGFADLKSGSVTRTLISFD